ELGISRSTLWRIYKNRTKPKNEIIFEIVKVLNLDYDYLFFLCNQNNHLFGGNGFGAKVSLFTLQEIVFDPSLKLSERKSLRVVIDLLKRKTG
ncbi:MAG: helix-turn-helix transcriptional regulator, partial [Caldisericia bacterium]|nr:helix-turn-helix transcriptional regulator [Caldisericia bacterium]